MEREKHNVANSLAASAGLFSDAAPIAGLLLVIETMAADISRRTLPCSRRHGRHVLIP